MRRVSAKRSANSFRSTRKSERPRGLSPPVLGFEPLLTVLGTPSLSIATMNLIRSYATTSVMSLAYALFRCLWLIHKDRERQNDDTELLNLPPEIIDRTNRIDRIILFKGLGFTTLKNKNSAKSYQTSSDKRPFASLEKTLLMFSRSLVNCR